VGDAPPPGGGGFILIIPQYLDAELLSRVWPQMRAHTTAKTFEETSYDFRHVATEDDYIEATHEEQVPILHPQPSTPQPATRHTLHTVLYRVKYVLLCLPYATITSHGHWVSKFLLLKALRSLLCWLCAVLPSTFRPRLAACTLPLEHPWIIRLSPGRGRKSA